MSIGFTCPRCRLCFQQDHQQREMPTNRVKQLSNVRVLAPWKWKMMEGQTWRQVAGNGRPIQESASSCQYVAFWQFRRIFKLHSRRLVNFSPSPTLITLSSLSFLLLFPSRSCLIARACPSCISALPSLRRPPSTSVLKSSLRKLSQLILSSPPLLCAA